MATIRDDWKQRVEKMHGRYSKKEAKVLGWGGVFGLFASHMMMGSKHTVIRYLAAPIGFTAASMFGIFCLDGGHQDIIDDIEDMIEPDTKKAD